MNLILSSKAAKQLRKQTNSIKDFVPDIDTWRVDCLFLRKRSIFIIANEKTLYTFISSYKQGLGGIVKKIASTPTQKNLDVNDIHYIKFLDRSILGSMNNMKSIVNQVDLYSTVDNERFEEIINHTPFKYLSGRSPAEVHLSSMSLCLED